MIVGDAQLAQDLPLGRSGGGEDLGADAGGRCWIAAMPTPPAPAWISTFSPARSFARSSKAVEGGGENRSGSAARLLEAPALGQRAEQRALAHRHRREGIADHPHHPVAGSEVGDLCPDLGDDARCLRCRSAAGSG